MSKFISKCVRVYGERLTAGSPRKRNYFLPYLLSRQRDCLMRCMHFWRVAKLFVDNWSMRVIGESVAVSLNIAWRRPFGCLWIYLLRTVYCWQGDSITVESLPSKLGDVFWRHSFVRVAYLQVERQPLPVPNEAELLRTYPNKLPFIR